ncbi:MAG TPA: transglycosylase domain-containing protein [Trebonia sp.]|jgi:membrane peptidoglycan carboxypeptidase|nr:transglycosylase domain-containing protein [Trebonia sp.]
MTETRPMPDQQLPPRQPARRKPGRKRRFIKRLAFTVIVLVSAVVIAFAVLLVITPSADQATQIAGQQASARGITYPGPPVPGNFAKPLVATEDKRFYSEVGVDPFAVVRFVASQVTGNTTDEGGATLEQQLAKLLYTPGKSGAAAEAEQVALAVKLNFTYSKAQILRLYAEVAYYGHGYYGLEAASCGYFGHPAADLTPVQGAMLAGVVNAPTLDDPINDPVDARARLDHVIGRMEAVGDITAAEASQLRNTSLGIVPRAEAGC